ncbi:hypothetical protein PZA11_007687 [Diplocarpon coronariae]
MAPSTRRSLEPNSSSVPKGTKRSHEDSSPVPAVKRGRGRPKKIQKTLEETVGGSEDSVMDDGVEEDVEVGKQLESSPPAPVKRGRGRPKKVRKGKDNNVEDTVMENGVVDQKEAVISKGRGRPKKALKKIEKSSGEASEDMEGNEQVAKQSNSGADEQANEPETADADSEKIIHNNVDDEKAIARQTNDKSDEKEAGAPKEIGDDVNEDANGEKAIATQPNDDKEEQEVDAPNETGDHVDEDAHNGKDIATQTNENTDEKEVDAPKETGENVENIKAHDIEDDKEVAKQIDGSLDKPQSNGNDVQGEKNAFDEVKADTDDFKEAADQEQEAATEDIKTSAKSIVKDDEREGAIPSSILEKGIIYFFFRGRVGVEDPQGIEDVARSYIVLRPLPLGAKLGDGPLEDSGNSRLLALRKKMLPKSRQDRFLVFVEQPKASIKDLREHLASNEYATKTSGTSHSPAATPFAEGIYAITSTGRESHLAYHITIPAIGEVQRELGLNVKGSFVLSAKNPQAPGPANASLPQPAQYPENIQSKFRDLRWMPLEPALLDYTHTQFLLIGEGMGEMDQAVEETSKDAKNDEKEKPLHEMEKLGQEDQERVEHLKQDDPIFADLGLSSKEYPKMQTTW